MIRLHGVAGCEPLGRCQELRYVVYIPVCSAGAPTPPSVGGPPLPPASAWPPPFSALRSSLLFWPQRLFA